METGYDNVVVATKAWDYLFAVVDWAKDLQKQKVPDHPLLVLAWTALSKR
jgi:hypothetical protein